MIAIYQGTIYVDADLEIRNTSIIADTAIEIQRIFQADAFGIEANQFQELLADEIVRRAQERQLLMPVWTYENRTNKIVRIRRLTPYLAKGMIRFKSLSKGTRLLVEQFCDLESPVVEMVLADPPLDCDILLAPHHGSAGSDPPGFAAWCSPEWVVVSGQRPDRTESTNVSYQRTGAAVLHTAERGAISFTIGGTGIAANCYHERTRN